MGLGCETSTSNSIMLICTSYSGILVDIFLVKERRHINITSGHGLVILVVAVGSLIPLFIQCIEHFLPSLDIDRGHILGNMLLLWATALACSGVVTLTAMLIRMVADSSKYSRSLYYIIFFVVIIVRKLASTTCLEVRLLKSKFAADELTICEVIHQKADRLTISTVQRLF